MNGEDIGHGHKENFIIFFFNFHSPYTVSKFFLKWSIDTMQWMWVDIMEFSQFHQIFAIIKQCLAAAAIHRSEI